MARTDGWRACFSRIRRLLLPAKARPCAYRYRFPQLDEIEKLKMFLFDGNGTLLPLTRSETYVQSEYSQPFGEEIIHDIKQENPDNGIRAF